MSHDSFCIYKTAPWLSESIKRMSCTCDRIAEIRDDERQKAIMRLTAAVNKAHKVNARYDMPAALFGYILTAIEGTGEEAKPEN